MRARLQEKLKQRNLNTEHQGASRVVPQQGQEPEQEENNKENNNTNK